MLLVWVLALAFWFLLAFVIYWVMVSIDEKRRWDRLSNEDNLWLIQKPGERPARSGVYLQVNPQGFVVSPEVHVSVTTNEVLPATRDGDLYWRWVSEVENE